MDVINRIKCPNFNRPAVSLVFGIAVSSIASILLLVASIAQNWAVRLEIILTSEEDLYISLYPNRTITEDIKINVPVEVPSLRVDSGEIIDPYTGGGYTPDWGQPPDGHQQYDTSYEPYGGEVRAAALFSIGDVEPEKHLSYDSNKSADHRFSNNDTTKKNNLVTSESDHKTVNRIKKMSLAMLNVDNENLTASTNLHGSLQNIISSDKNKYSRLQEIPGKKKRSVIRDPVLIRFVICLWRVCMRLDSHHVDIPQRE